MVHELKTWPIFFGSVLSGEKTFEMRKDDRNFQVGDVLNLREYDPDKNEYTGRALVKTVTYKLGREDLSKLGIESDYCILSLG